MNFVKRTSALFVLLILSIVQGIAQNTAIGYWESHLPYNNSVGIIQAGDKVFSLCNHAFFACQTQGNTLTTYSKVDGMSDIGMKCAAYDDLTQTLVLVYNSGSIDLFKNNTFYNIPDFKLKILSEYKDVFQVYAEDGFAYLSTTLGILIIDLKKQSITRTISFEINNQIYPVTGFAAAGNYFYAVTSKGLFRADKSDPFIDNVQRWKNIDSKDTIIGIAKVNNTIFVSTLNQVMTITGDTVVPVYRSAEKILAINSGNNGLLISVNKKPGALIKKMALSFDLVDSFKCQDSIVQATQAADNSIWAASPKSGLLKITGTGTIGSIIPNGPASPYSFGIYARNREIYVAHGGYNNSYFANMNPSGYSIYNGSSWTSDNQALNTKLNGVVDISVVTKDETNGTLYLGSYLNGLLIKYNDGTYENLTNKTVFDGSVAYGQDYNDIVDMVFDSHQNLWVVRMFAPYQLCVKTKEGNWYKYKIPEISHGARSVATDDSGRIWVISALVKGLVYYDTKNTLNDSTDDVYHYYSKGPGYGNLPSNYTICVTRDKRNEIWVGTDNGIAVFKNCNRDINATDNCEAVLPIVNYDQASGALFSGDFVSSIAVDAINRKWVGTRTGAWLLSPDASQVIHHFTKDNSPLPSDYVQKITIDPETGDVYIATDQGLVSYHGTATDGNNSNSDLTIFPNPVQSSYTGVIAIKGLTDGADVRITDVEGQLVYRTKALGGQAIWNGMDYTGHRPQTGIYLVYVSDASGGKTTCSKIGFIN